MLPYLLATAWNRFPSPPEILAKDIDLNDVRGGLATDLTILADAVGEILDAERETVVAAACAAITRDRKADLVDEAYSAVMTTVRAALDPADSSNGDSPITMFLHAVVDHANDRIAAAIDDVSDGSDNRSGISDWGSGIVGNILRGIRDGSLMGGDTDTDVSVLEDSLNALEQGLATLHKGRG